MYKLATHCSTMSVSTAELSPIRHSVLNKLLGTIIQARLQVNISRGNKTLARAAEPASNATPGSLQ